MMLLNRKQNTYDFDDFIYLNKIELIEYLFKVLLTNGLR